MKRATLGLLILNLSIVLFGQEVEIKGLYASSTFNKFQNTFGYVFGINDFVKPRTRMGISVEYSVNNIPYTDNYTADDNTKYMKKVRPLNQKVAVKFNCAFRILNKSKSLLYIGPEFGLIYFIIHEEIEQTTTLFGVTSSEKKVSDYYTKPAAGFGFLFEYELKEIIAHKISVSVSVHPELSGYGTFGMKGSSDPSLVGWLNAEIGFKYRFAKKE